ncbi:Ribosomal small subunit pseudouridine synthase A, partial [Tetrabaena socialis]
VEPGEFTDSEILVMLGENGTGKTTFIRMLAAWAAARRRPVSAAAAAVGGERAGPNAGDDDDGDDDAPVAGKAFRVERLLANLGYGKRRECQTLVKKGNVTRRDGGKLKVGDKVCWGDVVLEGEELDPPSPMLVALHKPIGYVVTSPDDENITDPVVYDMLPYRFGRRRPFLSCVGRLDKDTSGLLLLTDDGTLLHRINSPRRGIWKVYEAKLAEVMTPKQAEAASRKFASGTLMLEGDFTPLLPASLELVGERTARVAICEGRYHQVRRMFAAVGHKVVALHRVSVGGLALGSLPEAEWRFLTPQDLAMVFEGPTAEDILGAARGGGDALPSSSSGKGGGGGSLPAGGGAAERDGTAGASSSGSASGEGSSAAAAQSGGDRLTKKEKKRGKKERKLWVVEVGGAGGGGGQGEEEGEDDGDVELLSEDFEAEMEGGAMANGEGAAAAAG